MGSDRAATQTTFGDLVRQYRQAAMLSQEALAERAGLSPDAVGLIERGRRGTPRLETVALLARALDLDSEAQAAFSAAATRRSASGQVAAPPASGMSLPPLPLTSFIGREGEIASIRARLVDPTTRLLTLTGAGGSGKTRLVLEVARGVGNTFRDGMVFVDLSPLTDPNLVLPAIAQSLGVRETAQLSLSKMLGRALHMSQLLLVLDNFEQVLAAAPAVAALLGICSDMRVLVTSRVPLHVRGERLWEVQPLTVPGGMPHPGADDLRDVEAVRLFIERVQDVRPDFVLTDENAREVAEICRRLDGLPLAIELAAAWARVFSPQALVVHLEHRLQLLNGGPRDLPARQQTLRATIDWSYALLTEDEQVLLARLSVFVGGWTLEAAEAVCNLRGDIPVLGTLASLVDKNLVREVGGADPRFSMLETIKEYAGERLIEQDEEGDIRAAHAEFFTRLAEEAEPVLRRAADPSRVRRLEHDHENFRAALRWSAETESRLALRLVVALSRFWYNHGDYTEGGAWLEAVLVPEGPSEREIVLRAKGLQGAANLAMRQGDYLRATTLHEDAIRLWREVGDKRGLAFSLSDFSWLAVTQGEHKRTEELVVEAVQLMQESQTPWGIGRTLSYLARAAFVQEDFERARELWEESVRACQESGDRSGMADPLGCLGEMLTRQGDYERGKDLLDEALRIFQELGFKDAMASAITGHANLARFQQEYERAATLLGAVEASHRRLGVIPQVIDADTLTDVADAARAALGADIYRAAWLEGQVMSLEEAVTYALDDHTYPDGGQNG